MGLQGDRYTYKITWSEEDRDYIGLCVEFSDLKCIAKTPELALQCIRRAVHKSVSNIRATGESPPPPLSSRTFSGKFVIRIPPRVHRDLAIKAAEEGVSLNRLISARLSNL